MKKMKMAAQNNLNGYYCIASKLHYDKLVEDFELNIYNPRKDTYYLVSFHPTIDGQKLTVSQADINAPSIIKSIPMHLHNDFWVFGSLEHEEDLPNECVKCDTRIEYHEEYCEEHRQEPKPCSNCRHYCKEYCIRHEPKQVERITREDDALDKEIREAYFFLRKNNQTISDRCLDFMLKASLEANQKDK